MVAVIITPSTIGKKVDTKVHFALLVSLNIVKIVVLHGLCISEKSIRLMAVSKVQPPFLRIASRELMDSVSNIIPAPPFTS